MSTPSWSPAAHPRASWLTFLAVSLLGLGAAVVVARLQGAQRVGLVMTVFCGVVVIGRPHGSARRDHHPRQP